MRYMFSGKPFVSRTEFEGHAVRALYASSGATDYFTETGDPAFKNARFSVDRSDGAQDVHHRRRRFAFAGESFGDPYELPS